MDIFTKVRDAIQGLPRRFLDDAFLVAAIFLIALAAFGLGRLSVLYGEGEDLKVIYPEGQAASVQLSGSREEVAADLEAKSKNLEARNYVASINGTKYYLPTCGSAGRIKEENKIWFATKEEAELAGYEPAANCPGI